MARNERYLLSPRGPEVLPASLPDPLPALSWRSARVATFAVLPVPGTSSVSSGLIGTWAWTLLKKYCRPFDQFQTIHFRGWGEPLLNPHFSEMVTMASDSGARLVLTTNGQIMPKPDTLKRFENIFFRLDYGTAATYERRNPWARFNRAILNISQTIHLAGTDSAAAPQNRPASGQKQIFPARTSWIPENSGQTQTGPGGVLPSLFPRASDRRVESPAGGRGSRTVGTYRRHPGRDGPGSRIGNPE